MHARKPRITRAITHKFVQHNRFSFDVPGNGLLLIRRSEAELHAEAGSSLADYSSSNGWLPMRLTPSRQFLSCPLLLKGWLIKPLLARSICLTGRRWQCHEACALLCAACFKLGSLRAALRRPSGGSDSSSTRRWSR